MLRVLARIRHRNNDEGSGSGWDLRGHLRVVVTVAASDVAERLSNADDGGRAAVVPADVASTPVDPPLASLRRGVGRGTEVARDAVAGTEVLENIVPSQRAGVVDAYASVA